MIALPLVCTACGAHEGKTVFLSDYLRGDDAMTDAVPAIRAALEEVKRINASHLVLPGGELRLRPDKATERYQFISNNDESLKRIAFDLSDINNLTIDGNGSSLVFSGFISPFNLENCRDIVIENLSIDFTRTFHSEGLITNVWDGGIDIKFPDDYNVNISNGYLIFSDNEGIVYPYSNMLEFDSDKREPALYAKDIWLGGNGVKAIQNEDGSFRITGEDMVGSEGNVMIFGARYRYNPAFTLADCDGVTVRDVTLYHCGGMGVIAQRCRNIELNKLNITPGNGRMVSITADATHFVNCGGFIRMIDCLFENQKDDATNIHGLYMAVDSVVAPDRMIVRWYNSGQYGVDFIKPGMTLEIVDNENLNTYSRHTVKDVNRLNKIYTEVTFTEPLPDEIEKRHVVAADDEYPSVLIKGCRMRSNRARGLLLGSRGSIVVEDNYFHIPGAAILFEGDGNYWWEQSGVRDVVIRNNVFENCNYGYSNWGSACIAVGSGIPKRDDCRYHKNIKVEKNIFRVFDPRIINLYCVDGFVFTPDNRIEMTDDYEYGREETRNFVIADNCDNIKLPE